MSCDGDMVKVRLERQMVRVGSDKQIVAVS